MAYIIIVYLLGSAIVTMPYIVRYLKYSRKEDEYFKENESF